MTRFCLRWSWTSFYPRARADATLLRVEVDAPLCRFYPRARADATRSCHALDFESHCFYPRARADATRHVDALILAYGVSIRAPVRTRPGRGGGCGRGPDVSIRAPVRTRPRSLVPRQVIHGRFLSARPCGRDPDRRSVSVDPMQFLSARPCGRDPLSFFAAACSAMFLSARPCGRDPATRTIASSRASFYPRARADATSGQYQSQTGEQVSIRAPVRTRPSDDATCRSWGAVSIRAPVRTRPPSARSTSAPKTRFYPRARADATRHFWRMLDLVWVSIRAPVRTRPGQVPVFPPLLEVSIRAPVRTRPTYGWIVPR